MKVRSIVVAAALALVGFGTSLQDADAGSNLCPANKVCIYVDHEWVGLLGYRSAGLGLQNVTTKSNDRTSSWENKTATNARWFHDANGAGTCRTMIAQSELNITWYGGDNDKLTSWATNGACP